MRNEFDWQSTEAVARDALAKSSFDEFLFQVFVGKCKATVTFPYRVSFNSLTRNSDDLSYEKFLDVIGGKLGNDTPLLASVCLAEKVALTGKCSDGHILAINGLKTVCSNTRCDAYLKVLNTWGPSWQQAKSDGWLDAKTFYDYVERLSWLEWMTHFEQMDAFQGRLDDKAKTKTVNRLLALANSGDANAQRDLAWFYLTGTGINQNYNEAKKWYLKAAEFGDEEAQFRLGEMYIQGKGVPESLAEGVKWLKKSSGGNASRKVRLGLIYRDGKGTIGPDGKEAIKWLQAAAKIGSSKAEFLIGQMYDEGIAVAVNRSEAEKWYRLAASHGYEKAAEKLKQK